MLSQTSNLPDKYLLPASVGTSSDPDSSLDSKYMQSEAKPSESIQEQPTEIRFRDYVCKGLGREDDDRVARTYSGYLKLELAQALADEEEQVAQSKRRQLCLPQAPLIPYAEPHASDGTLLS